MSSKFTCRFCKEQFDAPKGLYKHLQLVHNTGISRDNRSCPICGVLCSKYESYRDHLLYIHGQTDEGQKLTFKTLNDFLVWKTELELKHNCKYVLQASPKVLPTKEKKYFYQCDRSNSKDKKSLSVVMKTCSSVISVVESNGVFKIEYWDTHSGHNDEASAQSELDAAISSVEMVDAICEDDELGNPDSPNFSTSAIGKQPYFMKTNNLSNSPVKNSTQKKVTHLLGKSDVAKKKANAKAQFSLASVACGKGIAKKPKPKEDNSDEKTSSKSEEISNKDSPVNVKEIQISVDPVKDQPIQKSEKSASTTISSAKTKTTPSGPLPIAPRITPNTTMNPLFTANSSFPGQFVILNQGNVEQKSLNPTPVFTTGQNILLSLGPIGQTVSSPQIKDHTSTSKDKTPVPNSNSKVTKGESSSKKQTSTPGSFLKSPIPNAKSASKSDTGTSSTSTAPKFIPGSKIPPVILSSLPVGSTFMSVNNNLIPIASPSGALLPTTLPPNIVLTPVIPPTSKTNASIKSVGTVLSTPKNVQTSQVQFSTPSTLSVTVSSIVKEPIYTSSTIKHLNSIVSSTPPVSSKTSVTNSSRQRKRPVPIAASVEISPVKKINKSVSSPKVKNSLGFTNEISVIPFKKGTRTYSSLSKRDASSASNDVCVSTPKPSARKRISRDTSSKSNLSPVVASKNNSSTFDTTVVNSRLHLMPISSTLNVPVPVQTNVPVPVQTNVQKMGLKLNESTGNLQLHPTPVNSALNITLPPQTKAQKPGTMIFRSPTGEIFMLEPIESGRPLLAPKSVPSINMPKIQIERSMQTDLSSDFVSAKSNLQRKRSAPPADDSSVMLKVKCYQLEMKYLNLQAECKRLKVELTKERLKNAELSGKNVPTGSEEEDTKETPHSANEIMKEIEDTFCDSKVNIYTMTKTSVLRNLYEDLEELCMENNELHKELENYREHDKFYKSLKRKLHEEEF